MSPKKLITTKPNGPAILISIGLLLGVSVLSSHAHASICSDLFHDHTSDIKDSRYTEMVKNEFYSWRMLTWIRNFEKGDERRPTFKDFLVSEQGLASLARFDQIRRDWNKDLFTSPRRGIVQGPFRFLAHAILDDREVRLQFLTRDRSSWEIKPESLSTSQFDIERAQEKEVRLEEYFTRPRELWKLGFLSASVISEKVPTTFGNSGFILESDFRHIYGTDGGDMGAGAFGRNLMSKEGIERLIQSFGFHSPTDILQKTRLPQGYNEIAISTISKSGHRIKVIGLYTKVDEHGNPTCSAARLVKLQMLSKEFNLPLVMIVDPPSARPRGTY